MYSYGKRRQDPPLKLMGTKGFSLGLNQLTHPSVIKNNELSECYNAIFAQNGVIKKRFGCKKKGTARIGDTKIYSLSPVYKINNQNYLIRIGSSGKAQYFSEIIQDWIDIPDSPTFPQKKTYIFQGYSKVYFCNENMPLTRWDGTNWLTYQFINNPTTAPTLEKQGTGTGPVSYYYRYVWFNEVGNTAASSSAVLTSMPDTLNDTTWIKVTLPTPPADVKRVGIFRGVEPGVEQFLDEIPASQTEYHDKGQKVPDPLYLYPTSNKTSGFKFKFATVYKDTIVGVTVDEGDDTLVFSGGLDEFDNFGVAAGGGFYSWRKGDGSKITTLKPFKEQLYVLKTDKIGVFDFSSSAAGAAVVKDINMAMGTVSFDSIHAAGNDLRGWCKDGAFSMGNEPNYADVIRTRILSARIQNTVDSIVYKNIDKIVSTYYKNLSIWAIPTGSENEGNTIMVVYDERYVAWSVWTGMKASVFAKYIGQDNFERLYYGDEVSGNVYEMFNGYNDDGKPINFKIATKQFDAGVPFRYKNFDKIYLVFGIIYGSDTVLSLIENGTYSGKTYKISAILVNQGLGVDRWGTMKFGETTIDQLKESLSLVIKYIEVGNKDLLNLQVNIQNSGLNDQIEIMAIFFEYSDTTIPLESDKRLKPN